MWGPFKQQVWNLPKESAQGIGQDLQNKFEFLMDKLGADQHHRPGGEARQAGQDREADAGEPEGRKA